LDVAGCISSNLLFTLSSKTIASRFRSNKDNIGAWRSISLIANRSRSSPRIDQQALRASQEGRVCQGV
jgi:hypothetical protein